MNSSTHVRGRSRPALSLAIVLATLAAAGCARGRAASNDAAPDATTAPGAPQAVAVVDPIPGKLRVRVFTHVITASTERVPCWTYVSDGLAKVGQAEIALTLKREAGEADGAFPREPIELLEAVLGHASRGQLVREGDATELRASKGFLRPDLTAILYTPGQKLAGVATPTTFLTALVVTGPELEVAHQFGHLRLMTLLGDAARFFPSEPWLDRRRPEVARPELMRDSVLAKVTRARLPGANVLRDTGGRPAEAATDGKVVLRVRRSAAKAFEESLTNLPAGRALALLVDLPPDADAALVFAPAARDAEAIAAPGATGARIAGDFLTLAPGVERDGARGLEDGYALMLTQASWDRLRAAVASRSPIAFRGSESFLGFELRWIDEPRASPVDGRPSAAPGG